MKKIAILGSTGSIGTQTLEVVRGNQDIQVMALAAGSNIELLEAQIREFRPVLSSLQRLENRTVFTVHWKNGYSILFCQRHNNMPGRHQCLFIR